MKIRAIRGERNELNSPALFTLTRTAANGAVIFDSDWLDNNADNCREVTKAYAFQKKTFFDAKPLS